MTLESIYYIGQTVAVVAILISLIAIFFQMRQGQAVERATAQRELMKQTSDLVTKLSEGETLYNDVRQCMYEYSTAEDFKKVNFYGWSYGWVSICEQVYYQNQDGLMNEASFNAFIRVLLSLIRTPGGTQWWREDASKSLSKEIRDFINRRLEEEGDTITPMNEINSFFRMPDAGKSSP